jgi:16S rRNA (adenine1518-N6/adenine1519-N6)-dimethyltransferase
MEIKKLLAMYNIAPDCLKDQFFLNDENIAKKIADLADIKRNDVVLEVGAGTGILTKELSKKAKKVIAFEIDNRFKSILNDLPKNVDIRYENAWEYIQLHGKNWKKKEYNKIVSNLPYSFVEQFLHNLTFLKFDKVILLVPLRFVKKVTENPIFGSFFKYKLHFEVDKEKFFPVPRTNSGVIELFHLPSAIETKNMGLYLRQFMYQHEDQKVKNSLMEGIIKFEKEVNGKKATKNQARKIVKETDIEEKYLEDTPGTKELYEEVGERFI